MPRGITFDTREEAVEYRDHKHDEGYTSEITYDTTAGKYRVTIGTGIYVPPEEEFPATPAGILAAEEEEEVVFVCVGVPEAEDREECLAAGGRWMREETAERTAAEEERKRALRRIKKVLPKKIFEKDLTRKERARIGGGILPAPPSARPYAAGRHPRIGTEGAIGANGGKVPRIMVTPKYPRVARTGAGWVPASAGFQTPYFKKPRKGRKTI